MKRLFKTTGLLATICCVLLSCSSGEENEKKDLVIMVNKEEIMEILRCQNLKYPEYLLSNS